MWCVALELTFRQDLDYWTKQTLTRSAEDRSFTNVTKGE